MTSQQQPRFFSYAQNLEDYHLSLLLEGVSEGFYIDIGGGHAVADNVSFWFYERGWRGIVVEPQNALAAAYGRFRPRDIVVQALCGRQTGEADFFQADRFHGLSTTVGPNAEAAEAAGIATTRRRLPVTTLAGLCAAHAPQRIDFLKIDVEGAETDVLAGNDWDRFRPRVVVIEAVAPWTMADGSAEFAPLLTAAGYRDVLFDGLNRFYLAGEDAGLAERLPREPTPWNAVLHLGEYGPADHDERHPDHALARHLDPALLPRLADLDPAVLAAALPAGTDADSEATRAALARIASMFDGGYVVEPA
ncbi:FkbM family methyltransferase [Phreatobacter sp.]|uniref:FkbM family methyltransferase n=1 Tax=Phreatobacter sp. TaxID=1966341 RepID=UPI003F71935A